MQITFKTTDADGQALLTAHAAHKNINLFKPALKSVEKLQEIIRAKYAVEGLAIIVGKEVIATIGAPRNQSKLDEVTLESFLAKHGKTLNEFRFIQPSKPVWNWV